MKMDNMKVQLRFEGWLLQMECFSSFYRCSIGFRSGLIGATSDYSNLLLLAILRFFSCVFWVIVLLEGP